MAEFRIEIHPNLHLSSIRESDKPALLEHLSAREVYDTTLNIPYPYTEKDADFWIQKRMATTEIRGFESTFAIREGGGNLIGSVGADSIATVRLSSERRPSALNLQNAEPAYRSHRTEIGYWLAVPYWNRGIMTEAVRAYVKYAFNELGLLRLTAHVFEKNLGSARVLEKNGFRLEGRLRHHFMKDGKLLDARIYGLLKEDWAESGFKN